MTLTLPTQSVVAAGTANSNLRSPAHKKVKIGASSAHPVRAHGPPTTTQHCHSVDTAPEHMKTRGNYRNTDLPAVMQADQRWAKKFHPTIMLWAGNYEDIWSIPDDVLLHHVQLVFNAVYKELKITIVQGGVVHSLVSRCFTPNGHDYYSISLLDRTAHFRMAQ